MKIWHLFLLGTIVCWGCYGPAIHEGQLRLGKNSLLAFLCVGAAYFLVAVLVPAGMILGTGDSFSLTRGGAAVSVLAGVFGALGALGVILALKFGGKPISIMPLVFGGAPIVNVAVSLKLHPPQEAAQYPFYIGMLLVSAGTVLILSYKPA
jgi:hypothetical protein